LSIVGFGTPDPQISRPEAEIKQEKDMSIKTMGGSPMLLMSRRYLSPGK
jgi:hypothetical protein